MRGGDVGQHAALSNHDGGEKTVGCAFRNNFFQETLLPSPLVVWLYFTPAAGTSRALPRRQPLRRIDSPARSEIFYGGVPETSSRRLQAATTHS